MSNVTGAASRPVIDVHDVSPGRWLVRYDGAADGRELFEGHIVQLGAVFQLRLVGDQRTRLFAPSFETSLEYFRACIDGSLGRLCSRNP